MQRLSRNARSYEKAVARAERQIARLRQRQLYYAKIGEVDENRWDGSDGSEFARRAHANRRLAEIAFWINELDLLCFALLGFRESQLVRRTVWSNRLSTWRLRGITRGRKRIWMPD